jgi:hypothetical protein
MSPNYDLQQILVENRSIFAGTLFIIKKQDRPPWLPSGFPGRYNGSGTATYYLADSIPACWREVSQGTRATNPLDYRAWRVAIRGTFVDIGAVEGTTYLVKR